MGTSVELPETLLSSSAPSDIWEQPVPQVYAWLPETPETEIRGLYFLWGLVPAYWAWVYQQQSMENEVPTNQPNTVRNG